MRPILVLRCSRRGNCRQSRGPQWAHDEPDESEKDSDHSSDDRPDRAPAARAEPLGSNGAAREVDLPGHLENEGSDQTQESTASGSGPDLENDYQLREALNLLKGINIVSHKG